MKKGRDAGKTLAGLLHVVFIVLPMALGIIGYYVLEKEPFLNSAFMSLNYYTLNNQDVPVNLCQEIARWMAPMVTASSIMLLFRSMRRKLHNIGAFLGGGSVAVYGNGEEKEKLLLQLGRRGISGEGDFVKADRYIFAGEENENIEKYSSFRSRIGNRPVHLSSKNLFSLCAQDNVYLFNAEETAARIYWKERSLYQLGREKGFSLKVCILGFSELGENLLVYGLLDNIFRRDQRIEYHVFGQSEEFQAVYHELGNISDPVYFHRVPWYERLDVISQADRVIACETNVDTIQGILRAVPAVRIDVMTCEEEALSLFADSGRLDYFDWKEKALRIDDVIRENLLRNAKKINLHYARLYGAEDMEETQENAEKEWAKLDAFTRYSNISSADYHDIQRMMLAAEGISPEFLFQEEGEETLRRYAELEHIRWTRYHYLNNWRKGEGKKDKVNRTHPLLVPNE